MSKKAPRSADFEPVVPSDLPPIGLPRPKLRGSVPLEACLQLRRSTRQFLPGALALAEVAQLLWSAQGVTGFGGLRTAPSAGALYSLRTYLQVGRVRGLPAGLFRYDADEHYIRFLVAGDKRAELVQAGLDHAVEQAPALIVLASDYRSATREYGQEARRVVHIEAGHVGQNVCLQATAMGLGVIGLGAMDPPAIRRVLGLREVEEPVYILAFGKKVGVEPVV